MKAKAKTMTMKYLLAGLAGLVFVGASACTPPCADARCSGGYGPVTTTTESEPQQQPPPGPQQPPPVVAGGPQQPPPVVGGQQPPPVQQPPVQQPPVPQPPPIPQTGARDCADQGKSCETDSVVADWLTKCRANNAPGPCHCAAAATWACFNAHHCFVEAGASTTLTLAQIRASFDTEIGGATTAQTQCNLLHP